MKLNRKIARDLSYIWWTLRPLRLSQDRHNLPGRLIVSLTSHPERYAILFATLKCLLMQDMRPDETILWVSQEDSTSLPDRIRLLQAAGLSIRVCEDARSYNKIIPAIINYPDAFIVTADDDSFYPPNWLRLLVEAYDPLAWEVVCHRAHKIRYSDDGLLRPYLKWELMTSDTGRSERIFPTGVGGVLYRPGILHPMVTERETFLRLSPNADDVWLFWMARLNGASARRTREPVANWMWPTRSPSLFDANKLPGGNDAQIANMIEEFGLPYLAGPVGETVRPRARCIR